MTRPLLAVPVPAGPGAVAALLDPLAKAMAGSGPAIAPIPEPGTAFGPEYAARVRAALRPGEPVDDDRCCLAVSTSGSLGGPSGVLLSARNLRALTDWAHAGLQRPQWVLALPLTAIGGINVLVRSMATDAPLLATPGIGGARPFTSVDFAETVSRAEPGADLITSLVPEQLRRLLADDAGRGALAQCARVLIGGEAASAELLREARGIGIEVIQTYGCTETTGGCVFDGIPGPDVGVRIDDGRICILGPTVALGYRDRAFAGEFRTADLGRLVDGRLEILGRLDDVVQVHGVNVDLGAVGAAVAQVQGVLEAFVVPGPPVTALVVGSADHGEIRDHVRRSLGASARPQVVQVLELPRLPNGKVDRAAAARLAQGRTPQGGGG